MKLTSLPCIADSWFSKTPVLKRCPLCGRGRSTVRRPYKMPGPWAIGFILVLMLVVEGALPMLLMF